MSVLYTIGHSNRKKEEFIALLKEHSIKHLIDVRTIPKSRFVPWSNQNALASTLAQENILYTHMPELGGMRHPHKDSVNNGWKNSGFRGYADYMQTDEFFEALKKLNEEIIKSPTVVMCAEAVPWRCHRSLIADAELVRKIKVFHIMSANTLRPHELTSFALVNRKKRPIEIIYPADANLDLDI